MDAPYKKDLEVVRNQFLTTKREIQNALRKRQILKGRTGSDVPKISFVDFIPFFVSEEYGPELPELYLLADGSWAEVFVGEYKYLGSLSEDTLLQYCAAHVYGKMEFVEAYANSDEVDGGRDFISQNFLPLMVMAVKYAELALSEFTSFYRETGGE